MTDSGVPEVTAVVLARNEARHLPDCLASLAWADEVLVLDSGSTDGTQELAHRAGARVEFHAFENYSCQRNFALDLVTTTWAFFVDADERVPPALAAEVRQALSRGDADGYWVPRQNVFWGHTMRAGGWWPDRQLRLLRVGAARYDPLRAVHELALVEGPTGELATPLVHLNYDSPAELRAKQRQYAPLDAERRRAEGWHLRWHQQLSRPIRAFLRRYVELGGWRDGGTGLVAALCMAEHEAQVLRLLAQDPRPAGGDQAV